MLASTPSKRNTRRNSITNLFNNVRKKEDPMRQSLDMIVKAYLLFDKEARGFINKDDVKNMMKEDGAGEGQMFLQEERWKEMDWNSDGTIEFSEFVYTFSKWVDIDED
jgi:Ca2+-binding EF-hand superfamily protein